MAESLTTKKALAAAIKELIKTQALEKISISEICEKCNLNRKSFYYHFEDKYDLINWIFDTEFLTSAATKVYKNKWDGIENLLCYLYENKLFYKRVLKSADSHIFTNHLKNLLEPILKMRLHEIMGERGVSKFQLDFYSDAIIFTIYRWLSEPNVMPYRDFLEEIKSCLYMTAVNTVKNFDEKPDAT